MYAVIAASGRQYQVAEGQTIVLDRQLGEVGDHVDFDHVLLVGGSEPRVGAPTVEGALVKGEIVEHYRAKKVLNFKMNRRHRYRKLRGFRRSLTAVRITGIEA
jgi:large subunit ribosomal protein L21